MLVCFKGRFVAMELKVPGKKPTKLQAKVLRDIDDAGGTATVIWDIEEVKDLFSELDNSF